MNKVEAKMNEETVQYYITNLENLCKKLQDKVKQLKNDKLRLAKKVNQLETNRDEAIEHISNEFLCYDNESDEYIQGQKAIEILERGKE